ncbi:hypothetical protein SNOG_16468 [Parastagonospora nodorum SN15]|uniref:Uncharacterized protein n=1 Tax=Phaeosphaeria nodorum (strain SN15 / ATCC MYA-4574 / FGSC 10173) TaxID=321614 RepID=Q0TVJ6_PHANO|nr:hypothetical protein SNOG_16468 [Parastagonospora nodorum SN15]EAT76166.1 hypothetical protein SNOG_16468 [Parastagonospora nodorum SN15]
MAAFRSKYESADLRIQADLISQLLSRALRWR